MPLVLARVDDRLIHGQVAHGWGKALKPTLFLVVSDPLAADHGRASLYLFAVPEGAAGRVISIAEALASETRAAVERERTVLLFPGLEEPLRLVEGGFPLAQLNLGGMHHAPGREEVLPYLFLDGADRERLSRLAARGVKIEAQDLPANPAHDLADLISRWSPS